MRVLLSKNIAETERCARQLLKTLAPQKGGATVLGLAGNLGAGKTAFAKCVAKLLGVRETVTSPTFVIMKTFKISSPDRRLSVARLPARQVGRWLHLIHVDAYRIEKPEELLRLGWREIVSDPRNLILLEWPERVREILPRGTQIVRFRFINETSRRIALPKKPMKLGS